MPETSPSEINPAAINPAAINPTEVSPELLNQSATPPEVVAKEIAIEKPATKMVKKLVKQTDPINKKTNLDSLTGDNGKVLPTSNTEKTDSDLPSSDLPSSDLPSSAVPSSPQQLMNLSSWINRHRFYPSDARRKGEEGTVLMRISFSNSGHLENYQVIKSSGSNTLDRAAAEILKRSAPYPEELVAAFSQAEVPLVFSLRS